MIFLLAMVLSLGEASMVTFEKPGGRFGDQLISYLHALWISYQSGLPLFFSDISFGNQLVLSTKHERYAKGSQLYTVPYHADFYHEAWVDVNYAFLPYIVVDWEDPQFIALAREYIAPLHPMPKLELPQERTTVAMHVRRGGGFDGGRPLWDTPMKFPPDQFYEDALREIAAVLDFPPLHVHLFTDAVDPENIVERYREMLADLDVTFSFREKGNRHDQNVLEDFFAMRQFDCLIYPLSNYSYIPSRIWEYKVRVSPRCYVRREGQVIMTGMDIEL